MNYWNPYLRSVYNSYVRGLLLLRYAYSYDGLQLVLKSTEVDTLPYSGMEYVTFDMSIWVDVLFRETIGQSTHSVFSNNTIALTMKQEMQVYGRFMKSP